MKASTYRGWLNAIANVYAGVERTNHFTPSCERQFPQLNAFMENCLAKEKTMDAIEKAEEEEVEVLKDVDVVKLWNATDFDKPSEVQRLFAAQLGYNTGLRGNSFECMEPECFNTGFLTDGRRYIQPSLAKMKNLVPSLSRFDTALFKQQIIERQDERVCAVKGFYRQLELIKKAPVAEPNYLFRTTFYWSPALGSKGCSENTWVGVYQWVSKVIGRRVTFKDIARRVAMTKLANSTMISMPDAAKFLGVQLKTLMVYHRKDKNAANKCATILAEPDQSVAPLESSGRAGNQPTCQW